MRQFKNIVILIFLFKANSLFAQARGKPEQQAYSAVHWSTDQGLVEGSAYHMLKDVKGFLWIGTQEGLSRFDGSRFKNYYFDPQRHGTISGANITGIKEDSLHNIWIGTEKGISRYDIKADTFANFTPTHLTSFKSFIVPFQTDKNQVYCLESDSLIVAFDVHSLQKKRLASLPKQIDVTGESYSAFDIKTNSVWLLQAGPPEENLGGLWNVALTTGKAINYNWNCYRKIPRHNHVSEGMCYDRERNCVWLNSNDGLIKFTLNDKKFYHVNAIDTLRNLRHFDKDFDKWHWVGIDIDRDGNIWLPTVQKGMVIYNPERQTARRLFPENDSLQQTVADRNACVYCDRDGMAWSGFWMRKGIYQLFPYNPAVTRFEFNSRQSNSLSHAVVSDAVKGNAGTVWLGTFDGLNIYDPRSNMFSVLKKKNLPGTRSDDIIVPVFVDTVSNKAWIIAGGLYQMDLKTHVCLKVVFKTKNNNTIEHSISYVRPLKHGCETVINYDNKVGVFVANGDSDVAHEIFTYSPGTIYPALTATNNDNMIFVRRPQPMLNETYMLQNSKWKRVQCAIDTLVWKTIFCNSTDTSYWAIAYHKILHYNQHFQLLKQYTSSDGLPDNPIYGLIADKRGNIWFNTDRSIYELNIGSGTISRLTEKDGYKPQNFFGITTRTIDDEGNLYFPAGYFGNGFDKISPSRYTSSPASVYVETISINQQPLQSTLGANNLRELSLKYFENTISIQTGVIDYYSNGKGNLRFKLEGLNNEWQYAPSAYTILFNGLPPNTYKLILQASNAANQFTGPEKLLIIHIAPAFWNTGLFRAIAAAFILALIYFTIRRRVREKFRLKLERSERLQQLAELKDKASQLEVEVLRSQMSPHFIFNCLSSINRFILKNKTEEASDYLTKFSRLIRMVLNNSKHSFITLEDELETLRLYLDMERLRFKNSFDYELVFKDALDAATIFIPPLLLQPFAENAIWHGLMHKTERGHLRFDLSSEEKYLTCVITDNGIGREKAEQLKSKSAEKQKSMGLKITSERLSLLNNNTNEQTYFTIEDLVDENGNAMGTRVHLRVFYRSLTET